MFIFLSMIVTITVCIYYFKLSPILNKKLFKKNSNFSFFITKSYDEKSNNHIDLVSFKHEFGETIFELQKEINSLKLEINELKEEISKIKT